MVLKFCRGAINDKRRIRDQKDFEYLLKEMKNSTLAERLVMSHGKGPTFILLTLNLFRIIIQTFDPNKITKEIFSRDQGLRCTRF